MFGTFLGLCYPGKENFGIRTPRYPDLTVNKDYNGQVTIIKKDFITPFVCIFTFNSLTTLQVFRVILELAYLRTRSIRSTKVTSVETIE